jgi:hypothetical protein
MGKNSPSPQVWGGGKIFLLPSPPPVWGGENLGHFWGKGEFPQFGKEKKNIAKKETRTTKYMNAMLVFKLEVVI